MSDPSPGCQSSVAAPVGSGSRRRISHPRRSSAVQRRRPIAPSTIHAPSPMSRSGHSCAPVEARKLESERRRREEPEPDDDEDDAEDRSRRCGRSPTAVAAMPAPARPGGRRAGSMARSFQATALARSRRGEPSEAVRLSAYRTGRSACSGSGRDPGSSWSSLVGTRRRDAASVHRIRVCGHPRTSPPPRIPRHESLDVGRRYMATGRVVLPRSACSGGRASTPSSTTSAR